VLKVPTVIKAHVTGSVGKIEVRVGERVPVGTSVAILESMSMEMPIEAEADGVVAEILAAEGQAVSEGDPLVELH